MLKKHHRQSAVMGSEHSRESASTPPDTRLAVHIDGNPRSILTKKCWERVIGLLEAQKHLLKSRTEEKAIQEAEQQSEPRSQSRDGYGKSQASPLPPPIPVPMC